MVGWTACLECICTNTHSTGNSQEELEVTVHQENSDRAALTETRWDDWHTRAAEGGYKLFRSFGQGRRGGGVALCHWEFGLSGPY